MAELVPARADTPPFDLTDAWGRRDVAAVLTASERIVERSGDSPRDVFLRIAALVTNHVTRVRECQALDAEGVPPAAAADRLKRNRFYVQKLYEQARNFDEEELGDVVIRLARLDLALKGGSKLPGELEFTRALIDITRPREPARDRLGAAGDELRGLRLLARGGVAMQCATGRGLVDPAHELAVLGCDLVLVAVVYSRAEPAGQGLDRRGVAEVLEALLRRDPHALLLLFDVRHSVKMPAPRAARW